MESKVVHFFDSIAPRYDLVNRIASFGVDRRWREMGGEMLLSHLPLQSRVADLAIGTGEMAEVLLKRGSRRGVGLRIVGVDPSREMLKIAHRRLHRWKGQVELRLGWGEALPVGDREMDGVSIGFGLRNYRDPLKGLKEVYRVLKPGGHLLILEFFRGEGGFRRIVDLYTNHLLPIIGGKLSGNREAYRYLAKSIERFYTIEEFLAQTASLGFQLVHGEQLNFGQVGVLLFRK